MNAKEKAQVDNVIGFPASKVLRDRVDQLAKEEDRSRAWMLRRLIEEALLHRAAVEHREENASA